MYLSKKLADWQRAGLLTAANVAQITDYESARLARQRPGLMVLLFVSVIGVGIISFIGVNWHSVATTNIAIAVGYLIFQAWICDWLVGRQYKHQHRLHQLQQPNQHNHQNQEPEKQDAESMSETSANSTTSATSTTSANSANSTTSALFTSSTDTGKHSPESNSALQELHPIARLKQIYPQRQAFSEISYLSDPFILLYCFSVLAVMAFICQIFDINCSWQQIFCVWGLICLPLMIFTTQLYSAGIFTFITTIALSGLFIGLGRSISLELFYIPTYVALILLSIYSSCQHFSRLYTTQYWLLLLYVLGSICMLDLIQSSHLLSNRSGLPAYFVYIFLISLLSITLIRGVCWRDRLLYVTMFLVYTLLCSMWAAPASFTRQSFSFIHLIEHFPWLSILLFVLFAIYAARRRNFYLLNFSSYFICLRLYLYVITMLATWLSIWLILFLFIVGIIGVSYIWYLYLFTKSPQIKL